MADETYTGGLRDLLGNFRPRALLILDEAHHAALLEILDPQRFTRGVPVKPRDLDPVMVRRLKSDLRHFGETFPERVVEEIRIACLPSDAPELLLSPKLAKYGEAIRARTANLPPREAGYARLTFVGLQQRPLSSIAAFAKSGD